VIARLGGVTLSVLLHAGLIALLLAWSAVDWTRPLFVDLGERAESPGSPTGEPSGARSARPAGRAAGPALPPARASARPEPVAPVASGGPASAPAPPPVAPAVPPALAIAPEPVVEPATTPAPAPAAVPPAPSASSAVSASDSGSGAVAGGGAQTRGDGDRGSGGGPGASLALVTPGTGGSGAAPPEYGAYLQQFRQRVQESLVYPLAARRQGLGGTVELHVWLEATGRVRDVQIARSSSHRVLDDAAVEAIRRLGPVPFPESLPRRPLLVRIPLVYELR
jgi:periplasmic protein TonB